MPPSRLLQGAAKAVSRSLRIYHGDAARRAAMDRFYRQFLGRGDLAFDIGAHVGDRVSCFRRLGATVVAVEPQPGPARAIRLIHGRDSQVTLVEACCSDRAGSAVLQINSDNPTVSTASEAFISAASGTLGWEDQQWDRELCVPCVTLDDLISKYGLPRFIKIDVEGFEERVLSALSHPVPALSFEFTLLQPQLAMSCLSFLEKLGQARFNVVLGESLEFAFAEPIACKEACAFIASLPPSVNSGDVYAFLNA